MADIRALYLNAGVQKQTQYVDVLRVNNLDFLVTTVDTDPPSEINLFDVPNAVTSTINFLTGLTTADATLNIATGITSGTVNLATSATGAINIGDAASTVTVHGDFSVQGDETIVGDTTFETNVTFGDNAATPTLVLFNTDASIGNDTLSSMVFNTTAGPQTITTNGSSDLTITTATTSDLVVSAAVNRAVTVSTSGTGLTTINSGSGGIDLTGGGTIDITTSAAGAIVLAPYTGSDLTLTTTGTGGELTLASASTSGSGAIQLDASAGGISLDAAGSSNFTTTSGTMTLQTSGANNINLTSGSGIVNVATTNANQVLALDTTGSTAAAGIYVCDGVPGSTANNAGSLWLDTTNGQVWVGGGSTSWAQLTTGGSLTLQDTYANSSTPAQITLATEKNLEFITNETATTEANFLVRLSDAADSTYLLADAVNYRLTLGNEAGTSTVSVGVLGLVDSDVVFRPNVNRTIRLTADTDDVELHLATRSSATNTATLHLSSTADDTGGGGYINIDSYGGDLQMVAHTNSTVSGGNLLLEAHYDAAGATTGGNITVQSRYGAGDIIISTVDHSTAGQNAEVSIKNGTVTLVNDYCTAAGGQQPTIVLNNNGGILLDNHYTSGAYPEGQSISLHACNYISIVASKDGDDQGLTTGHLAAYSENGYAFFGGNKYTLIQTTASDNIKEAGESYNGVMISAPTVFAGGNQRQVVTLRSGESDPTTTTQADANCDPTASLYFRDVGGAETEGQLWIKQGNTDASAWSRLALVSELPSTPNLQQAYNTGATIEATSGRDLIFETFDAATVSNFIVRHQAGANNYLATNSTSATAGTLQLGSANVTLDAGNTLAFTSTNRTVQSTGASLTVQTLSSGALNLTGAGGITSTSTGGTYAVTATGQSVTVDGAGISIDGTANSNMTTTATATTAATLTLSALQDVGSNYGGTVAILAEYAPTNTSGGLVSIDAQTAEVSLASVAGHFLVQSYTPHLYITGGLVGIWTDVRTNDRFGTEIKSDNTDPEGGASGTASVVLLTHGEGTLNAGLLVYSGDPNGTITAPQGSFLFEVGTGAPYFNTDGAEAWSQVASIGDIVADELQNSYNGGATIEMTIDRSMVVETFYDASTPSNFYLRHEGGGNNYIATTTTSTTAGVLQLGSTNVTIDALNSITFDSTTGGTLTRAGANSLSLTQTGTGSVVISAADNAVTIDANGDNGFSLDGTNASNVTATAGNLTLSTAGASGNVIVTAGSTNGIVDINATGSGGVTVDAGDTGAVALTGHAASSFTTDVGNLTLSSTATAGQVILSANGASAGAKVQINSTNATNGVIELNTTTLDMNPAGATTLTGGTTVDVRAGASSDYTLGARGGTITLNQSGSTTLSGFTATSIVGALNELKADAGSGLVSNYVVATGVTIAIGDSLYIDTDGKVALSDADALATAKFVGIAKTGGTGDGTVAVDVFIGGEVTTTAIGGTSPNEGDYVYLSGTAGGTAGDITKDAPTSGILLRVGVITAAATNKVVLQVGVPVEL
jgi:hypothetical protein